jgi:hypothetical protein
MHLLYAKRTPSAYARRRRFTTTQARETRYGWSTAPRFGVEIADDVLLVKTTMSRPDTATLLALVAANLALLQREWKKLHGPLR